MSGKGPLSKELVRAYRKTIYLVEPFGRGGGVRHEVRVGSVHPHVDLHLDDHPERPGTWALITGYNPASKKVDRTRNRNAHRRLRRALERVCVEVWPGSGVDPEGREVWYEPMWFAAGIDREHALELGRAFGQNAIVFGEVGGTARLLACRNGRDLTR